MFEDCLTIGDVKNSYRKLAFQLHPDMHPASEFSTWNARMQDLNAAYMYECSRRDGEVSTGTDQKEHKYKYNREAEDGVINAVARAIRAKLPARCTVTIVGVYIWIEHVLRTDTDIHNALKGTKNADGTQPADRFYFHGKRSTPDNGVWYWKPPTYRRARYNKNASLSDLKAYYGARTVEKEEQNALTA